MKTFIGINVMQNIGMSFILEQAGNAQLSCFISINAYDTMCK